MGHPDRLTVQHVAALAAAAAVGGWLQGRIAGWPWEGAAVAAGLVGYVAYRDQRRRRLRYPPADEPAVELAGSLAVDGSPCRGYPFTGVAARLVERIDAQLSEAAGVAADDLEGQERLWDR